MKLAYALSLLMLSTLSVAQPSTDNLDTKFSCNLVRQEGGDGERLNYADQGVIQLQGSVIKNLQWESSLFRSTNGHECSIDLSDEPQAEQTAKGWRISLSNAADARSKRGYDFERGLNCSIRLERSGDELAIKPSCPALCGSRVNFTTLTVNLKNGQCQYDE